MADTRPDSLRQEIVAIAACDQRDLLPRIAVPTLLVWGAEDVRSPVATVARQFEEAIPGAELVVIPAAGHMANLERPAEFNDAVRAFCLAHPLARSRPERAMSLLTAPPRVLVSGVQQIGSGDALRRPGLHGEVSNAQEAIARGCGLYRRPCRRKCKCRFRG